VGVLGIILRRINETILKELNLGNIAAGAVDILSIGKLSEAPLLEVSSSIGRAPVSKTGGCGFDSCLTCVGEGE
jgi:hypothetical protein